MKTRCLLALLTGAMLSIGTIAWATKTDTRIESSFRKTAIYKSDLQNEHIHIHSSNGHVLLTGYVTDAEQQRLAGEAALSVRDVRSVDNRIGVSDRRFVKHRREAEYCDPDCQAAGKSGGVPKSVFLHGDDMSCYSYSDDRAYVGRGPVDHYQTQSDRMITHKIRAAIYNDSSLDDAYNKVTITTVKGHVTLDGGGLTTREKHGIEDKAELYVSDNRIANHMRVGH